MYQFPISKFTWCSLAAYITLTTIIKRVYFNYDVYFLRFRTAPYRDVKHIPNHPCSSSWSNVTHWSGRQEQICDGAATDVYKFTLTVSGYKTKGSRWLRATRYQYAAILSTQVAEWQCRGKPTRRFCSNTEDIVQKGRHQVLLVFASLVVRTDIQVCLPLKPKLV
jgi:hypothetical protein